MLSSRVLGFAFAMVWTLGLVASALAEGEPPSAAPAGAAETGLLNEALEAMLEHQRRWAYTETRRNFGSDGKPSSESVFRLDPSAPYAEQYKPLKVRGKPPTEKQLKQAVQRGERAGKRNFDEQEKRAAAGAVGVPAPDPRREEVHLSINGQRATPQIALAKVLKEDATTVTYEIPMRSETKGNNLIEKFELTARVNKESRQFESATIRQRESVRVKLIAKISATVLTIEFSRPDPRYPALPTKFITDGRIALGFGKDRSLHQEAERTDIRHVTPYDERFDVKIGPTRTLEL